LLPLLACACTLGPDYRPPSSASLGVPAQFVTAQTGPAEAVDLVAWWQRFDDPMLTALIERAAGENLDVAQAIARLRQAREALVQSRADRLPSIEGSAGATRSFDVGSTTVSTGTGGTGTDVDVSTGSRNRTSLSLGLDASWTVDIFGGVTRSIEAARAENAAAAYDVESVRTAAAAEVASNYIQARLGQARLAIAEDTLRTQDENLQIAGWRVQAGLVSALDSEQARAQRAQTAASIPSLRSSFANAANRLAVLTGQAPGALTAGLMRPGRMPIGPSGIALGIPAHALRQRPDVRGAERTLAAATARIGVARAALYPALGISGNVGTSATSIGGLGDLLTGGLFAGLTQVIFDGGRLRSQARAQEAAAEGAFAAYRQTVLNALEEIENGLDAREAAQARAVQLRIALDAANNAAIYARSQYRAGLTDFQTLLESERSLLSARDSLAVTEAESSSSLVQLYLALGGGWRPFDPSTGSPS
jgi:NodT family efflux transporter outer membrane factor (OMF) lipoprotein